MLLRTIFLDHLSYSVPSVDVSGPIKIIILIYFCSQYKIQDEKFTNRKLKKILREFRTHNNVIKHVGVIPIQKLTKSTNLDPSLILVSSFVVYLGSIPNIRQI